MSRRLYGIVLVLAGVLGGNPRAESVDPELRARVAGLLGAYRAVTVAEWRALGSEAGPVLEAVARDAAALPTRRTRALAALGAIQAPDSRAGNGPDHPAGPPLRGRGRCLERAR